MSTRRRLSIVVLAAMAAFAGCVGPSVDAGGEAGDRPLGATTASVSDAAAVQDAEPLVQEWVGHMVAGAAFELPAHFTPSDEIVSAVWRSGFVIEVQEAPEVLEIQVQWTSAGPSDLWLMVHGPHGAERDDEPGWSEYATHEGSEPVFATEGPLCMRIPAADVAEDVALALEHGAPPRWYPMVHSHFGADVELAFTVTSIGGDVAIPDVVHGHESNTEEITNLVETSLGPKRPWEPCEISNAS